MEAANNSSLLPSALDLLLVFPRLAQRAPEFMDNIAGKIFNGGSVIAHATAHSSTANSTITNTSAAFVQSTASSLESTFAESWGLAADDDGPSLLMSITHGIGRLKQFGGIFSYLTSKWALTTFAVAIILNRVTFYASSRENLRLRFHMRLALYLIPIAAFAVQLVAILQAIKCQTSPDFAQIRYGDPLKKLAIDFAGEGGFLYRLSSTLLFWQDDASCCIARDMSLVGLEDDKSALRGSLSLLYRFFITLCTSQIFETLACALQGKKPMPETGMTIFEHSLAFAECEAMISNALGFGFFGQHKSVDGPSSSNSTDAIITRAAILRRLNVPPEVLLVCLISCFSHLSSATLAVTGIRHKVRLVNTAIWACCYMSAFLWSFQKIFMAPLEHIADLGVLRFPTVCIVGFIPHLLILTGILVCGAIYSLALLITALSVPSDPGESLSFRQRLSWAYNNLQANVQFSSNSSIRIKMSEDFYTTLLKIGFNVLTAASEAVYLNEGSKIHVAPMTWLEQKRINEIGADLEKRKMHSVPSELLGEGIARGVSFIDHQNAAIGQSPYARERKSRPTKTDGDRPNGSELDSGLGLSQRRSRMQLTFDFIAGIFWLVIGLQAQLLLNTLRRVGIQHRPAWLLKAAGVAERSKLPSAHNRPKQSESLDFYMLGPDGTYQIPDNNNFDVEAETRRRIVQAGMYRDETHIGDEVYRWWRTGGRFGDVDESGDFEVQSQQDDDLTSVASFSTTASMTGELDEEGRRTPTQFDPYGDGSRETTPASEVDGSGVDVASLARLLNPQTLADREEARLLSYSLQNDRPMTRSQYRRTKDRNRAELLSGLRASARGTSNGSPTSYATAEDEEADLEQFILSQRAKAQARLQQQTTAATWQTGAEGMGDGGPQCVVCASCPRTILVWPCGCLSMCDECRVGLAARNYTKCICCRTDIAAYSRLYVP